MSFRGASAEAFVGLSDALTRALTQTGDAAQVGADLFSVAGVLRGEPALRRVATDVSVDAAAKTGLVNELFSGKVSAPVAALLADAVTRRWTYPRDLPVALEQLAVVATVKSAGADGGRLSTELFSLAEVVKANPDLRSALSDPVRSTEDKRGLVHGLLADKALPATIALADQAVVGSHRTVAVALAAFQHAAAAVQDKKVATVTVARPLADADAGRLIEALKRQHGSDVQLNVVIDPEVIGGIRVEIGDDVVDGTVASRLDGVRRKLAV